MKSIALVVVFVLSMVAAADADQYSRCDPRPTITVRGDAEVKVKPDKVMIGLGVGVWDKDIHVAKQKNNDIVKKTLAAIRESGIPEKDIQTSDLSIAPRREQVRRNEDVKGYWVSNSVVLTLREPSKVEEIITKALELGVNSINGISFQTTELKKYREQAREMALKAAKEKADKMAAVLGQSVGAPIQINEGYNRDSYYSGWRTGVYPRGAPQMQSVAQGPPGSSSSTSETVALGMISITANVTVTFSLKGPSAE
jgi:uncharacterized protein